MRVCLTPPPLSLSTPTQAAALTSVVTASGNTADASWTASFESICAGKEIEKAITSGCGGGGGGGGGGGAAAAVEEEKVEEEPEEEAAIGGLFGGGGDEEDAAW